MRVSLRAGRWGHGKQERKSEVAKTSSDDQEVKPNPQVIETGKKLQEDIDHLVDEIDEVLEENAAEFVKNYVQKGESNSSFFSFFTAIHFFVSPGQCGWFIGEVGKSRPAFDTLRISSYDRCCSRFLRHT